MEKLFALLLVVAVALETQAEFRTWTDQNGNTVDAEFVGVSGPRVVLKKTDGKEISLSPSLLSDADREYLQGKVPDDLLDASKSALDRSPPLSIEVKISKNTNTLKNEDLVTRDMTLVAKLRKKSTGPYSRKLTAELIMVGIHKEDGYWVMLDRSTIEFDLAGADRVSLEGKTANFRYYANSKAGVEYEGNVVVIRDDEGKVLDVSASSKAFEKSYESLSKFNRDDVFTQKTFTKKGTRSSLNIDTNVRKNLYL